MKITPELPVEGSLDVSHDVAVDLWTRMTRIRSFETEVSRIAEANEAEGYLHTYAGEEAVAVGVIPLLGDDDWLTSTYRNHGHAIARGVPLEAIAGELYGRVTGVCGGRGGSMHVADQHRGMIGAMGIVAAGLPIAAGAAFAAKYRGESRVAATFFGDGAVHQGAWHEALEFASLFDCPVIFVCENNLYAETTAVDFHLLTSTVIEMVQSYKMPTIQVDGMDVWSVRAATARAIEFARSGGGPVFLEALTYRYGGQYEGDTQTYKPPAEVAFWKERDPLRLFRDSELTRQLMSEDELDSLAHASGEEVHRAFAAARQSPYPEQGAAWDNVYTNWEE